MAWCIIDRRVINSACA